MLANSIKLSVIYACLAERKATQKREIVLQYAWVVPRMGLDWPTKKRMSLIKGSYEKTQPKKRCFRIIYGFPLRELQCHCC
jgi:hypothetical protein